MPNNPKPKSTLPLIAPNMQSQVQQTIDQHPEIDSMDEEARGEIIDITDWRVNGGADRPWGRKARSNDPANPNLNTDAMCYLRPDGLFEIYDCISGVDGNATWDPYGPFMQGENGYWWPPQETEHAVDPLPPTEDYQQQLDALHDRLETLEINYAKLEERVTVIENALTEGWHAHGPVNLPIVLESLTSLRCKGDIDVDVKAGHATPPPDTGDDAPDLATVVVLRRILDRRPDES